MPRIIHVAASNFGIFAKAASADGARRLGEQWSERNPGQPVYIYTLVGKEITRGIQKELDHAYGPARI
jgi:hypothetical protein